MRFQRKRFAIVGGILAAFALTVGVIAGVTNKKEDASAASTTGTVVIGSKIYRSGKYITNNFSMAIDGVTFANGGRAWCGYGDSGNKTPGYKNNGGTVTRTIVTVDIDNNSSLTDKKIFEAMYYGIEHKAEWGASLSDDDVDLAIHYAIMIIRGKWSSRDYNSGALLDYMARLNYALPNKDDMKYYYSVPGDENGKYADEQRIYSYSWREIENNYISLTVKKNWQDSFDSTDTRAPIHVKITKSDGTDIINKAGEVVDLSDITLSAPTWTASYYNLQELGDGVTFVIEELTTAGGWNTSGGPSGDASLAHDDVRDSEGHLVNYYIPSANDLNCEMTGDYSWECTATNKEKENAKIRLWTYKHWKDTESENRRSFSYVVRAFVEENDGSYTDVSGAENGVPGFPLTITKRNSYNTSGSVWGGVYITVPKTTDDATNPRDVVYAISENDIQGYKFDCADDDGNVSSSNKITVNEGGVNRVYCKAGTKPNGDFEVHWVNTEETVELTAYKTWNDGGNASKRPLWLIYEIYQDGEYFRTENIVNPTISAHENTDIWSVALNLPKYKYDPETETVTEHTYTYKEVGDFDDWMGTESELSENYTIDQTTEHELNAASDTGAANGMINTAKTSVPVKKCWIDDETSRPDSISFDVYINGTTKPLDEFGITLTARNLDDEGCWSSVIEDLPAYDSNGNELSYYAVENDLGTDVNYLTYVEEEGVEVCAFNAAENFAADAEHKKSCVFYNVQTVDIPVKKVWAEDKKEDRPGSIEVSLLCGDDVLDTVTLSEENNLDGDNTWEYVWTNRRIDECKQGYSVAENINIPGYATKITGNAEDGFVITNTKTLDSILTWGSLGAGSFGTLAAGFFVAKRKLFGR